MHLKCRPIDIADVGVQKSYPHLLKLRLKAILFAATCRLALRSCLEWPESRGVKGLILHA